MGSLALSAQRSFDAAQGAIDRSLKWPQCYIDAHYYSDKKIDRLYHRLHRLDLLPPNLVKADNNFLPTCTKNGEQIIISKKGKKQRPLSTEFTETHYFRKQLASASASANGKDNRSAARPISWALPKVNFSRMLNGAEIMTVDEQNHRKAPTTTCSRVTTDL